MAKNLYSQDVDQTTVDNLVSGTIVPCKVIPVTLAAGSGILPRGTLLSTTDGIEFEKAAAGSDICCVLILDVDTTDPDECEAAAAFSGEFNQNRIEEVMGVSIAELDIVGARARQIYIAPMNSAPEVF